MTPVPSSDLVAYAPQVDGGGSWNILLRVYRNLSEHCNPCARDTPGRRCRQISSHVAVNAILGGQLRLWRRLVELGIVELVQSVLRKGKQLLSCAVRGDQRLVLCVLIFSLRCRISDCQIQRPDTSLKGCNFRSQRRNCLLRARDRRLLPGDASLQRLFPVIGRVKLQSAILFFVIILCLLLAEKCNHVVDHLDDLPEATRVASLSSQCEHQQLESWPVPAGCDALRRPKDRQGPRPSCERALLNLQKARARRWQRLLEQLQCIIIIQDLDCVCDGNDLCCASLRALFPLCGLSSATCLQLRQKFLVLQERSLSVR